MDAPEIPATEHERAVAVEELGRQAYQLLGAGRFDDVVELAAAWHKAVRRAAPEDELALADIALVGGWALHLLGDEHAAERDLTMVLAEAFALVDRYRAEAGTAPGPEAEDRLERAERVLGTTLNHLGVMHMSVTHDLAQARAYFTEALEYRRQVRRNTLLRAQTLANLGLVEEAADNFAEARKRLSEATELLEAEPAVSTVMEYPNILSALGHVELALGDEDAAERHVRAALALARARASGDSLDVANLQGQLAGLLLDWGSPAEAEIHLRQALGVYTRTTGETYGHYASACIELARALWCRGHLDDATTLLQEGGLRADLRLRHALEIGSEEQRLARVVTDRAHLDICLSMAWEHPEHRELGRVALDALLRRKALSAEVFAKQRSDQRGHELETVRDALRELDAVRGQLHEALLSGVSEETVSPLVQDIRRREAEIGVLQRLEFTGPDEAQPPPDPGQPQRIRNLVRWGMASKQLAGILATDEALVEYADFLKFVARPWEQTEPVRHSLAIVWHGGQQPLVVPLGESAQLKTLADELGAVIEEDGAAFEEGRPVEFAGSRFEVVADRLRAAVLDPVLRVAGDVRRLILVPDGALASVPFGMLPKGDGFVTDYYELVYEATGRDLLRHSVAGDDASRGAPVVVADPDYDAGADGNVEEGFERLAGTRVEGLEVAGQLGVSPVVGEDATEHYLKSVTSPEILHIATHGWYLPATAGEDDTVELPEWATHRRLVNLRVADSHTYAVRSGLVLAGFNSVWAGAKPTGGIGDGLLTSAEAAGLELSGTELVFLSACETGRGHVLPLEGAVGLVRAFLMAGSRAIVTTLWKVPDEPSRRLSSEFYRRLLAGVPRAAALHDAQLAVRADFPHPCNWGGFILHGDPGPLSEHSVAVRHDDPPDPDFRRRLGAEAIRRRDFNAAEAWLRPLAEDGDGRSAAALAVVAHQRGDEAASRRWLERAAEAGEPVAAFELGFRSSKAGDDASAEHWWRLAMSNGNDDASQNVAALLYSRGERDEARRIWRAAAERAHPASLFAMGDEAGLDGDFEEAVRWWEKAAEAGEPRGARRLAVHAQQRGDDVTAERWWYRAAELGDADAVGRFAEPAYQAGRLEEAMRLWRAAAELGNVESAHNLGVLLDERGDPAAEAWWRRAAEQGFPQSAYNLANLLYGRGDADGALEWWRVAAGNGHLRAGLALGTCLLERGALEEAHQWLAPMADAGVAPAAAALAEVHERCGDAEEAARWFGIAAVGGEPEALHRLAVNAAEGGDWREAAKLWSQAIQAGHAGAAARYAGLLQTIGRADEAEELWEQAAEAGDEESAVSLASCRLARGDREGARRAAAAAAGERAAALARLLDADEELIRARAERGHYGAVSDALALAEVRRDDGQIHHWLAAAAAAGDVEVLIAESGVADRFGDRAEQWLSAAAKRGRSAAARALGERYARNGKVIRQAIWLRRAKRLAEAEAENQAGHAAYQAGRPTDAERHWQAAAERGSVQAMTALAAALVHRGAGPDSDKWLRAAVRAGDAGAASTLGALHAQRGEHETARRWFDRALALGRGRAEV